ncbi:AMP-binding protein [Dietzia kunjamensis]|uniref:class I adenylate-forming enzyme family protein n=1 Tax=Dietzia kunjamensis TaxID=322509 RepID=UPI002DB8AB1E|nr:AMP-binding protein [Dietzia kunjamensis]MEB8326020.1 AMP-binding protein [Dietzia kunjamensis]
MSSTPELFRTEGTLWPAFERTLRSRPTDPALAFGDSPVTRMTYGRLHEQVLVVVDLLARHGVCTGDRVALYCGNHPAFVITDLAVMRLGAVKVPLSAMLTPREAAELITRVDARVVVTDRGDDLAGSIPGTVVLTPAEVAAHATSDAVSTTAATLPPYTVRPEDPAVIYFTGGTTGKPKGIVHSQASVLSNLVAHLLEGSIGTDERLLLTTPLVHAAGLFTLAGLLRGATIHITERFDAAEVARLIRAEGITWTFMVPTMISRLVEAGDQLAGAGLRTIQYGAAPISADLLRRAMEVFGPVLQQLYAQTECPNFGTVLTKADHVRALEHEGLLRSCGRATLMCEVRVLGDDDQPAAADEVGEICLRSPYLMSGYWQDEAGAAERYADGWLRTGDVGYLDAAGYLYLVDRRNDMVVTGGLNVYSREVEIAILEHPDVEEAAVFGVPDPDWGEKVAAHVVLKNDGATGNARPDLNSHCRTILATYKVPKLVEVVSELPVTRYGKIDKKAIKAAYWRDHARAVN